MALTQSAAKVLAELQNLANPAKAAILSRFFKTAPGQYGEGDVFLGVIMPNLRKVVRANAAACSQDDAVWLLQRPEHEARMAGVLTLVQHYEKTRRKSDGEASRRAIKDCYLAQADRVNNWDLVDLSAPNIVGAWLVEHPAELPLLDNLAASGHLWRERIAMLATFSLIRAGRLEPAFALAETFLGHRHDLMHKACGWMLREAGKRDRAALEGFLHRHGARMPRTMLRYAIEHFSPAERQGWMDAGKKK